MVIKFNDYELMRRALWEMNKELQIWSYKKAYRVDYDLCEIVCVRKDVADILIKLGGKVLQGDSEEVYLLNPSEWFSIYKINLQSN
tara:strand:+ start:50 stop:307 length:258 start_codon:yes stop_codon:yes gene_type:complete